MVVALYLSIWIALALFAAGETARRAWRGRATPAWAWRTSAAGLLLAAAHVVLAFEVRHAWSHESAVRETARQTSAVYGLDWGGGLYVNFAFLTVWGIDLWRWRTAELERRRPSRAATWFARAVYLIVIVNGAVIFASGMRRALGLILVSWLLAVWSHRYTRSGNSRQAPGRMIA